MRTMDAEGQIVKLVVVFDAKQKPLFQRVRLEFVRLRSVPFAVVPSKALD